MQTILVCDDDKQIVEAIDIYLTGEGFQVIKAYDGYEALELLENNSVDLMIVDVMMPGLDGIRTTLKVRETSSIPIIILSAKSEDADKILGLNIGADDYITKPFNILEVKARIKAILRRNSMRNRKSEEPKKQVIVAGTLKLDRDGRRVFVNEKEINLTAKEFDLLELLVCNPNKVYSREALLAYVWGNKAMDSGDVRTVDVHVRRLREKIEPSPSDPKFVHTKWGVGYYFQAK